MSRPASAGLRGGLDEITNDRVLLVEHAARIAALGETHPHAIRQRPVTHVPGFNCFAFALGLHERDDYLRLAAAEAQAGGKRLWATSAFADSLVPGCLLPRALRDLQPGDVVLYRCGGHLMHAAIAGERPGFVSKWGQGHVYEHALWEVPARYGHAVSCHAALPPRHAWDAFLAFARRLDHWQERASAAGIAI